MDKDAVLSASGRFAELFDKIRKVFVSALETMRKDEKLCGIGWGYVRGRKSVGAAAGKGGHGGRAGEGCGRGHSVGGTAVVFGGSRMVMMSVTFVMFVVVKSKRFGSVKGGRSDIMVVTALGEGRKHVMGAVIHCERYEQSSVLYLGRGGPCQIADPTCGRVGGNAIGGYTGSMEKKIFNESSSDELGEFCGQYMSVRWRPGS